MSKTTEESSHYQDLEHQSVLQVLTGINQEDHLVAPAVQKVIPQIEAFVSSLIPRMQSGGRLIYIGAGTSGRLGIVDASECPPTFGVDHNTVLGIMAGGDAAIRKAVEFAEDDEQQAWKDLQALDINANDTVVGIAASGSTPYVIGGVRQARESGLLTAAICCNKGSALAAEAEHPIEVIVGPEFITGSTRMKAGTAQKLVLNMISTSCMIALGRVKGNKMVDMQLSNDKLVDRGTRMVAEATGLDYNQSQKLLLHHGSVRKAVEAFQAKQS